MGAQDDYNEAWERGRDDERERAALLVEMRANIARASADRFRCEGTYITWLLRRRVVARHAEMRACYMDAVAHAFGIVALCIRAGYDPRHDEDPDAKADLSTAS